MNDTAYAPEAESYTQQNTDGPDVSRRNVLKAVGGAAAVSLAGCLTPGQEEEHHEDGHDDGHEGDGHGHDHDEGDYTEPQPSAEVGMVSEDGQHYTPHLVWIEEGGTVTWHNESGAHTATAYSEANDRPSRIPDEEYSWDSGTLTEEGATYEKTFDEAGVYDYLCTPHEGVGMVGTVLVGRPDPHDQPGLEEPQAELPEAARKELEELNAMVNEKLGHGH